MKSLVLSVLLAMVACGAHAQSLRPGAPVHGPVSVDHVVDGDTLVLASDLGPRTVRLIGIDAPEMSDGDRGVVARERLHALVAGRRVWVEVGAEEQDRYQRLLAYLYVEDPAGRWEVAGARAEQVNLLMVEGGWADTLTIAPNTAYATLYAEARAAAVARGAGLWGARAAAAAPLEPGPVRIACALVNPSTPNDAAAEWVSVVLTEPTDTTAYYLWDEGSRTTFRLPVGVQPAGELRVVNPGQGVWNNSGDTVYLMREGVVVDTWTYGPELAVTDRVACRDPR